MVPLSTSPVCSVHIDDQIWPAYGKCGLAFEFRKSVVVLRGPHRALYSGPRSIGCWANASSLLLPSVSTLAVPFSARMIP
ncbi:unannotated protein [freshwater metagenome]|uniref:Unannotated protein n=1 Tax=freshwater metagenome TaxID=449393 RepID=A0A6J7I3C6_9ZZZZ